MAIVGSDFDDLYQSANMPEDDSSTSGGAIAAAGRVHNPNFASDTAPKIVSSDAGDSMNVTIVGRTASGALASETKALNGTTEVSFSTTFKANLILKVTIASAATGTVTVKRSTGETIVTLAPGVTSSRVLFYGSASDPSSTKKRYEKIYKRNDHGSLALLDAVCELTADPSSKLKIGIESSGNQSVANRLTAPGGVTFVDDNVEASVGDLDPAEAVGIWFEETLGAGDAALTSTFTLRTAGGTLP